MKIASPRARTHSGSASCADTLRLDSTTIHAAPASRLATSAVGVSCARPSGTSASTVPSVPAATSRSEPSQKTALFAGGTSGTEGTDKSAWTCDPGHPALGQVARLQQGVGHLVGKALSATGDQNLLRILGIRRRSWHAMLEQSPRAACPVTIIDRFVA
jgi:hypothetical protein